MNTIPAISVNTNLQYNARKNKSDNSVAFRANEVKVLVEKNNCFKLGSVLTSLAGFIGFLAGKNNISVKNKPADILDSVEESKRAALKEPNYCHISTLLHRSISGNIEKSVYMIGLRKDHTYTVWRNMITGAEWQKNGSW